MLSGDRRPAKKNLAYEEEDKNAWGMRRSIHEVEGLFLVGH